MATVCCICGEIVARGPLAGPYCSKRCRSRASYLRRRDEVVAKRRAGRQRELAAIVKTCPECLAGFTPERTARQRFCSDTCKSRWCRRHETGTCQHAECDRPVRAKGLCAKHYKARMRAEGYRDPSAYEWSDRRRDAYHRRRAIKQSATVGGPVLRDEIAERDQFTCGLCGLLVDMSTEWPDAKSPSLDHIVPLAEGGDHSSANCQLAHLACNVAKGARGGPQQLALIG